MAEIAGMKDVPSETLKLGIKPEMGFNQVIKRNNFIPVSGPVSGFSTTDSSISCPLILSVRGARVCHNNYCFIIDFYLFRACNSSVRLWNRFAMRTGWQSGDFSDRINAVSRERWVERAAVVPGLSAWRSSVSIGSWADAAAGRGQARRPSETAVFSDSAEGIRTLASAARVSKSL